MVFHGVPGDILMAFLTEKDVIERTTLSRSALRRAIAKGDFPPPSAISPNRIAFDSTAIEQWEAQKAAPARAFVRDSAAKAA
jgi:predicted DNA-binding transcriptional regulator AlpA